MEVDKNSKPFDTADCTCLQRLLRRHEQRNWPVRPAVVICVAGSKVFVRLDSKKQDEIRLRTINTVGLRELLGGQRLLVGVS